MGSIQRMYRGMARKKYKPKNHKKMKGIVKHYLSSKKPSNVPTGGRPPPTNNNISKKTSKRLFLEFGASVKMMFKVKTEDLLRQKNPCTVYELALTWEQSSGLNTAVRIDKNLEKLNSRNMEEQQQDDDLAAILKGMQQLSVSHSTKIQNWSEAEEALSKEGIIFRGDDSSKIDDAKSLETLKSVVRQKAEENMRKRRMKSFGDRILHEQLKHEIRGGTELKKFEDEEEAECQENINRINAGRETSEDREMKARMNASKLLRPLAEDEEKIVNDAIHGIGPSSDIMAQVNTDIVLRESMQRLQPYQWLNDEVIHYFLIMLANRDEKLDEMDSSRGRSHFFKSYFITKLLNEGHATNDGVYEYRNVKRWSKKVPGKDIFKLNKVVIPINVGNAHWVCAVIFFREKRIQMYDSLGGNGKMYLEYLFQYLQDEHLDKKKEPLPDAEEWKLISTDHDTPRQENGFDCGVFTCMFADFLSNDHPLLFTQEHITQCRERIALSIMKGSALID